MNSRFIKVFFAALSAVVLCSFGHPADPTFSAGPTFIDVPLDHPYYEYIEALYQNGYVAGCSSDPLMYCPEQVLDRAESAVFVERGVHGAGFMPVQPTGAIFADVALSQWYARWAAGLWNDGYTAGCSTNPLIYCPDQDHSRAEGCVFYLRMLQGADYRPPNGSGTFSDVDPEAWYADWVDACWHEGIAESCDTEPLQFCPEEGLTRAAAAYMMVQASGILHPTPEPTIVPTAAPTIVPTAAPTIVPTAAPTIVPTAAPTIVPTAAPTIMPTAVPTAPTPTPPPDPASPYATFADGLAPVRTLWVSDRGSAGGDGSFQNPYASLAQAQGAAPGTEIRVEGRISGKNFLTFNGSAAAPIWVRGEPGTVVDGLFLLTDSNYVIIEDLEFTGSHDHQLHIQNSHYILMQRLDIHHPVRYCLKVYHGDHIYLFHSDLHDAETNTTWIGTHNGRILGNHMSNAAKNMLVLKGGSQDIFVAFNEFENQIASTAGPIQLGNATGGDYFNPRDADYEGLRLVFFANMVHGVTATPISFMGCRDCAAIHNTIFDIRLIQDAPLVRFLPGWAGPESGVSESVTDGCRFSGNIVVGGTEGSSTVSTHSHGVGPGNTADYNVFLKPGPVNWHGVVPQDFAHSTYDQDPRLDGRGIPQNYSLVHAKGPADLSRLPFSQYFVMDFYGNPFSQPDDIGSAACGSSPNNQ